VPAAITTDLVWKEVEKRLFAVLAYVTPKGEARTAGIVYVVRDRQLYIATGRDSWKARHIEKNGHVSLTVTIAKRIPFLPWIKIPAATVTFQGVASVSAPDAVSEDIRHALLRGLETDQELTAGMCVIQVKPHGDFITYGVGVPLLTMRKPEESRGRAPV
jgi:hypothetical protein